MNFLINTFTGWEEPPRSRHQLAYALSKDNVVYFLCRNRIGLPKITIAKESEHIILVTPYFPLNYRIRYRTPLLNEIYQNWLFKRISSILNNDEADLKVINFDHTATQIYKYFKSSVYYCVDEWVNVRKAKAFFILPYIYLAEKKVIKKAKFCVGVSPYLRNKLYRFNKNSHLIFLAAPEIDKKFLKIGYKKDKKGNINIHYVGFMDKQRFLLIDWIINMAKKRQNWKIKLIGPMRKSLKNIFKLYSNIEIVGGRKYEDLYEIISDADVFIIPYKFNKEILEYASMPNKVWLYLAFGKPIVSSLIPNAIIDRPFIYQSKKFEEFLENIELAYQEDCEEYMNRRIKFANQNTWIKRAEELINLLNKHN